MIGGCSHPSDVKVKVTGAVTQLPHMLLCCVQGQIYLYIIFGLMCLVSIFYTGNSHESRTHSSSSLFGHSMPCSSSMRVWAAVAGDCIQSQALILTVSYISFCYHSFSHFISQLIKLTEFIFTLSTSTSFSLELHHLWYRSKVFVLTNLEYVFKWITNAGMPL